MDGDIHLDSNYFAVKVMQHFLVIRKVIIFFMATFVDAEEFVGGEITRRKIKL